MPPVSKKKAGPHAPTVQPVAEPVVAPAPEVPAEFSSVSSISNMIEKLGLPTALLLVVGYFAWTGVFMPVVTTVQTAIEDVAQTNEDLKNVQEENNKADLGRVKLITQAMEANKKLLEEIIENTQALMEAKDARSR